MDFKFKTKGTCSREITFSIDGEGKLHNVEFHGGCAGNAAGISRLVEGWDAVRVMELLDDTKCGPKPTSCPEQLAKAIRKAMPLSMTPAGVFRSTIVFKDNGEECTIVRYFADRKNAKEDFEVCQCLDLIFGAIDMVPNQDYPLEDWAVTEDDELSVIRENPQ